MLNAETKKHIDSARNILVGVAPSPMTQVDLITTTLIYKFMDDMDQQSIKAGGNPKFFTGELEKYSWSSLIDDRLDNQGKVNLFTEALTKFATSENLTPLFREIFKNTFLPFRNPSTFKMFIDEINYFDYSHAEELGNAFEYLLTILSVSGDAGQFRTPRNIIQFIVDVVDPKKDDKVLDPACGTAGFLVEAFNHILEQHDGKNDRENKEIPLTPEERINLMNNIEGYDITPEMARLSSVNLFLHGFKTPKIYEYDTLSSEEKWGEKFDVILANPPFMTPTGGIVPHSKFSIKAKRSEVLFVDYILSHLKSKGRAGIIVPEGVIFQSGNAFKELRKKLLDEGLYCVASLPAGVFNPYAGVKTSILFIDKELAKTKDEILFVKIENDGFDLGAQRRPIDKNDLPEALEVISKWIATIEINSSLALTVSRNKIYESKDLNLSFGKYDEVVSKISNFEITSLKELEEKGVITLGRGNIISKIDIENKPGDYPVYSSSAMGNGEFGKYGDFMFEEELITWSIDGGGKFFYRPKHRFSITNVSGYLRINNTLILNTKYLFYILNREWDSFQFDYVKKAHPSVIKELYKIPFPPIDIQQEIVEELDRYQNIIDGAKKIIENWVPTFEINPNWEIKKLKELITFEYGYGLPERDRIEGKYPVVGSNGIVGTHNSFKVEGPGIVIGRKGSAGKINWVKESFYPIDTTYFVKINNHELIDIEYLFFSLLTLNLEKHKNGGAVPGINRNDIYEESIHVPDLKIQVEVVEKIKSEKAIIDSSSKLIAIYEQKIKDKIDSLWKN
jgi:type I restriction enzyme M protein